MNGKKAKSLRKAQLVRTPGYWCDYQPQTVHAVVTKNVEGKDQVHHITDPIRMMPSCGRKLYQQSK